jgi:hypothetical protein
MSLGGEGAEREADESKATDALCICVCYSATTMASKRHSSDKDAREKTKKRHRKDSNKHRREGGFTIVDDPIDDMRAGKNIDMGGGRVRYKGGCSPTLLIFLKNSTGDILAAEGLDSTSSASDLNAPPQAATGLTLRREDWMLEPPTRPSIARAQTGRTEESSTESYGEIELQRRSGRSAEDDFFSTLGGKAKKRSLPNKPDPYQVCISAIITRARF